MYPSARFLLALSAALPFVLGHHNETLFHYSFVSGPWTLVQQGSVVTVIHALLLLVLSFLRTTGVSGQQLAVVSETKAIIFDKVLVSHLSRLIAFLAPFLQTVNTILRRYTDVKPGLLNWTSTRSKYAP
jgi:hypothetical protein